MKQAADEKFAADSLPQVARWRDGKGWHVSVPARLSIGTDRGDSNEVLGVVAGAVRLGDGSVAVADLGFRQIRIFDQNGVLRRVVGRKGEGPGEFLYIDWIGRCGSDSIFVHDGSQGKMIVFDPDVRYVRDVRMRAYRRGVLPYAFACDAEGEFAVVGWPEAREPVHEGPHRPLSGVSVSDHGGGVVSVIGRFPGQERYRYPKSDMPNPFGATLSVAIHSGLVYVGTGDDFEVRVFGIDGAPLATLRWRGELVAMTAGVLEKAAEADLAAVSNLRTGAGRGTA